MNSYIPNKQSNKYNNGVVSAIVASKKYLGAGILVVRATYRAGAGIVFYHGVNTKQIVSACPEVVAMNSYEFSNKTKCFIIGPGNPDKKFQNKAFEYAIKNKVPMVIDGSALFKYIADGIFYSHAVLTPHSGEAQSMLKMLGQNTDKYDMNNLEHKKCIAQFLAKKTNSTIVLKGYDTVVANTHKLNVQSSGSSWMATAGSGDVLSGILGAIISKSDINLFFESVLFGVKLHQKAGLIASKNAPIIASDIICSIPNAFRSIC
jgi:hydroxyethylthiazole kinase-like uncharacterized protein yjeF